MRSIIETVPSADEKTMHVLSIRWDVLCMSIKWVQLMVQLNSEAPFSWDDLFRVESKV